MNAPPEFYGAGGNNGSLGITAGDVADTVTDFIPIVGSVKDIYQGFRDGNGWQVALGAGGLVLDVFTYYGNVKNAAKFGEMKGARLVKEWNPATGIQRSWYETLDHLNRVRQVHPKYNNLPHYEFDKLGKYIGLW